MIPHLHECSDLPCLKCLQVILPLLASVWLLTLFLTDKEHQWLLFALPSTCHLDANSILLKNSPPLTCYQTLQLLCTAAPCLWTTFTPGKAPSPGASTFSSGEWPGLVSASPVFTAVWRRRARLSPGWPLLSRQRSPATTLSYLSGVPSPHTTHLSQGSGNFFQKELGTIYLRLCGTHWASVMCFWFL